MNKGPVSQFIQHHYRHFNAAALLDAARGYETHLLEGGKMMVTLAGAMSTGELGISLAEMIRQGKIDIISCTGANLEEDVMNLVAHSHYKRIPHYRDLTPQEEWDLLENHYNRVTDTCIPEEEAFRRLQKHLVRQWKESEAKGELDRFIAAMISIRHEIRQIESGHWPADDNPLKRAPHTQADIVDEAWQRPYSRQQAAFPLPWVAENKFWPSVNRVDDVYGDRHLFCSCMPVDESDESAESDPVNHTSGVKT